MAGVASPMLRRNRWEGIRFLTGLALAGLAAGVALAIPLYLAGSAVSHAPLRFRLIALALIALALGAADLANRTPHVWRQVPQRYVRVMTPGVLGVVWGFDLGLLFTTQKTTSLLWASIAAVWLLDPSSAPVALIAFAFTASAGITLWSYLPWATTIQRRQDRRWVRQARWISAAMLLAAGVSSAVTAALG